MTTKSSKTIYRKLTQLEHLLKRPHMYVGQLFPVTNETYRFDPNADSGRGKMVYDTITYSPGILKLFDEIILNACDHVFDSKDMTKIWVTVTNEYIEVKNNGAGIPIVKNEDGFYIPEMIFSQFLTSSNYDDSVSRIKSGMNGLGAKITSAFSTKFIIETVSGKKKYTQIFRRNLSTIQPPIIEFVSASQLSKKEYTKITFYPDFKRFKVDCIDQGTKHLLERRTYDITAYTPERISVFLNGENLNIKTFKQYVSLFLNESQRNEVLIIQEPHWKIAICSSSQGDDNFKCISFVNGVCTKEGTHVNYIVSKICNVVNKKLKARLNVLKNYLTIILFVQVENPEFESQAKNVLTSTTLPSFNFTKTHATKIFNMKFINSLKNYNKFKEDELLTQGDGKKVKKLIGIPHLDDAIYAGTTEHSSKCTLFITEGLSAKTFAVSGLSKLGREYFGIFPIKGKLLNVRASNSSIISKNVEIQNLKKVLGLQMNMKGDELRKSLRYGKVCLLTDADHDAYHIRGLLINFFHYFWPELLQDSFLMYMKTPIVKIHNHNEKHSFYTMNEYKTFLLADASHGSATKWKAKYYKGLGSSTSLEARESFQDYPRQIVEYVYTNDTKNCIELAFSKRKVEDRKEWIQKSTGKTFPEIDGNSLKYDTFFKHEFVQFSIMDCQRSIPNIMDGLKPSQRKILYGFLKKNTLAELKVDQIRGYIAEQTLYAHGDTSLNETIISMNQDFVGSNNLNLFIPCGAFGSRLLGGKDAASPRYISTKLNPLTRLIFKSEDQLTFLYDGDIQIEPEFYVPIIPMVLVNGATGIGTGYSCDVPCFAVKDIIQCIESLLMSNGHGGGGPTTLPHILPSYNNFKGTVQKSHDTYITEGIIEISNSTTLIIKELPIGVWTERYKEVLESLVKKKIINSFANHSTETEVLFRVHTTKANLTSLRDKDLFELFKLRNTLKLNLTLFDENNVLRKFTSVHQVIKHFYKVRIQWYEKRYKEHLEHLRERSSLLKNKIQFIKAILAPKGQGIDIFKDTEEDIRKYLKVSKEVCEMLMNMRIQYLTKKKLTELQAEYDKVQSTIKAHLKQTASDLWKEDLNQLKVLLSKT